MAQFLVAILTASAGKTALPAWHAAGRKSLVAGEIAVEQSIGEYHRAVRRKLWQWHIVADIGDRDRGRSPSLTLPTGAASKRGYPKSDIWKTIDLPASSGRTRRIFTNLTCSPG